MQVERKLFAIVEISDKKAMNLAKFIYFLKINVILSK